MDKLSIIIIIIQVIILVAIFVFKNTIPTYLKEKAKNIATKEDVGGITKEIESIKASFNKDLEEVKAELSVKTQSSFSLQETKRTLIYDLVETYNRWLYSILNFSFSGYNIQNIGEIKTHRKNLERFKLDFNVIENKLNMFYNNQEFDKLKNKLTVETLRIQLELDKTINDYESKLYKKHNLEIEDYFERTHEQNNIQTEIFDLTGKFYDDLALKYKNIFQLNLDFTIFLKDELENDIKND